MASAASLWPAAVVQPAEWPTGLAEWTATDWDGTELTIILSLRREDKQRRRRSFLCARFQFQSACGI